MAIRWLLPRSWRINKKSIDSQQTEIITLNQAERNHWIEAMKPVWLRFEEEIGKDLIDAAYYANME